MIKRLLMLFLLSALLLGIVSPIQTYAAGISVIVNGRNIVFHEASGVPFIDSSNRTQVPIRQVMEEFGASVIWNESNQTVMLEKDGVTVKVPIGQSYIYVNDKLVTNDTAALIKNDRTYLPLRSIVEAFGSTINWNQSSNQIVITNEGNQVQTSNTKTTETQIINPIVTPTKTTKNSNSDEIIRHRLAVEEINARYIRQKRLIEDNIQELRSQATPYYGSESDYQRDLATQLHKIGRIEKMLSEIQFDDSFSANATRLKLQEELQNQKTSFEDFNKAATVKSNIEALNEELVKVMREYEDALMKENNLHLRNLK